MLCSFVVRGVFFLRSCVRLIWVRSVIAEEGLGGPAHIKGYSRVLTGTHGYSRVLAVRGSPTVLAGTALKGVLRGYSRGTHGYLPCGVAPQGSPVPHSKGRLLAGVEPRLCRAYEDGEARQPRTQGLLKGYSRGTQGVLKGYSRGTQGVLKGYSRGTQGALKGHSGRTQGVQNGTHTDGVLKGHLRAYEDGEERLPTHAQRIFLSHICRCSTHTRACAPACAQPL